MYPRVVLPADFYAQPDTLAVAQSLLGKSLFSRLPTGQVLQARIVETEAYCGTTDKGCHAYGGRRTARNEVMWGEPGYAYVYFTYGMHHLLNVVTHSAGQPHAVLIRAVEPLEGIEQMLANRGHTSLKPALTAGPARLTQAMGITVADNGTSLQKPERLWIADAPKLQVSNIGSGARIGIAYAQEHANLPWRFWEKGSIWVSR